MITKKYESAAYVYYDCEDMTWKEVCRFIREERPKLDKDVVVYYKTKINGINLLYTPGTYTETGEPVIYVSL